MLESFSLFIHVYMWLALAYQRSVSEASELYPESEIEYEVVVSGVGDRI